MKKLLKKRKETETEQLKQTVAELRAKFEELKHENSDLLFTLDEYTKKENSIFESIGYIEEKKREQTKNLNAKYALELEKIKFFEQKWFNIVKNSADPTMKRYVLETRNQFDQCRKEIVARTRNDLKMSKSEVLAEEDYIKETERLDRQSDTAMAEMLQKDTAYYVEKALELSRASQKNDSVIVNSSPILNDDKTRLHNDDKDSVAEEPDYASFVRERADYSPKPNRSAGASFDNDLPQPSQQVIPSVETQLKRLKLTDTDVVKLLEKFSV